MALLSKAGGSGEGFEPVPMGTHMARCVTVVDLGLQETTWQGAVNYKHQVYIAFEVPKVRVKWTKDDKEHEGPAIIGNRYTNSIGEKSNLGKHLTSWRGKAFTDAERDGFDLFTILDVPCQLSVVHNVKGEKTYANISAVMGLPAGVEAPLRETDILAYSPHDPERNDPTKLPEWLKSACEVGHRKASESSPQEEYEKSGPPLGDFDDELSDIPF